MSHDLSLLLASWELPIATAGPEGYMAENIPIYAYAGVYTGISGERGI
jgi:hypothetical protein